MLSFRLGSREDWQRVAIRRNMSTEFGMGAAGDNAIWRHAARTGAALITKDEDFAALAAREPSGAQVVWLRVGNISNDALWRVVDPHLDEIVQALNSGEDLSR